MITSLRRTKQKGESPNNDERSLLFGRSSRPAGKKVFLRPIIFTLFVLVVFYFNNKFNNISILSSDDKTTTTTFDDGTSYSRPIHPLLKNSLAKVSSENGWKLDPKLILESIVEKSPHLKCNWVDFVSESGKQSKLCAHDESDMVSREIIQKGRWKDCDILPKLWNSNIPNEETNNSIYIEIGANIGSCVMEMLLSAKDVKIIAFEPHPYNLFMLLNTIGALSPSLQERIVVVPVGLGDRTATDTIYSNRRNRGNSVIGKVIKDFPKQNKNEFEQHTIYVEKISSIIKEESVGDIPLLKLDAQGYECKILDGLELSLLQHIRQIKLEVADKWLHKQKCRDLFTRFRNLGFELRSQDGEQVYLEGETRHVSGGVKEVVAVRKIKG